MDDKPHKLKRRLALRRVLKGRLRAYYKFLARQPIERFASLLRETAVRRKPGLLAPKRN
jgi:hypothetical protein